MGARSGQGLPEQLKEHKNSKDRGLKPPTSPISLTSWDFPSPLVFGAKICAGSGLEIPEIPETEVVSLWAATA